MSEYGRRGGYEGPPVRVEDLPKPPAGPGAGYIPPRDDCDAKIIALHQTYARRIHRLEDRLAAAEQRAEEAEQRELETMASSERIALRFRRRIAALERRRARGESV